MHASNMSVIDAVALAITDYLIGGNNEFGVFSNKVQRCINYKFFSTFIYHRMYVLVFFRQDSMA